MDFTAFRYMAIIVIVLWVSGIIISLIQKKISGWSLLGFVLGIMLLGVFIAFLWISIARPPLRTLGETRLWYSFFLPVIGLITYSRWKYPWLLYYSFVFAMLFLLINIFSPENYSKSLMPALQSPWFVPHVVVYLFAYAMLAASSLTAFRGLYVFYRKKFNENILRVADNLVYIGFAFLTTGLLFGALWAKEAWGHYWTWDPKETWAFLTWSGYLIYIHIRWSRPLHFKPALWILSLAFVVLLVCWLGINYLPSAQTSVHTYSQAD